LLFGPWRGCRLAEVPVDYLARLRRADWLWPATRAAIDRFLRRLMKHPGRARLSFGKHAGERLDALDAGFLDWLLGTGWIGPATRWLVAAELRKRSGRRLVYTDPLGLPAGAVDDLAELEKDPFEPRAFVPSEAMGGAPRRPSTWSQRRPPAVAQADDERVSQDLGLPPAHVGRERRDRNRVFWAAVAGQPTLKADDADASTVRSWADALEGIDALAAAGDLAELDLRYARASARGWPAGAEALQEQLDQAYAARRDQLLAGEVDFTDAARRVEPTSRRRGRGVPESARVVEVQRRFTGCRSLDDLLDVAYWVARHAGDFSEQALAALRSSYARCRSALALGQR
jgi:hypothetical protein